jgi:NADH-quinone oxidoreductase subunit K
MEFFISEGMLNDLLGISCTVIFLSLVGISFTASDYIQVLVYVELALLGVNLNLIYISLVSDDILGQILVIFILSVAAAESAIALSVFIVLYRVCKTIVVLLVVS